jgi:hypothetical protein
VLKTSGRDGASTGAVWAALIGDVLVTLTKIVAAVATGSAAMTSDTARTTNRTGHCCAGDQGANAASGGRGPFLNPRLKRLSAGGAAGADCQDTAQTPPPAYDSATAAKGLRQT